MSNTFKTFAIVGAGGAIGQPVLESLLASNASKVVILTRPDSTSTFKPHAKQTVEKVKPDDANAVSAVLRKHGVEVLVSTVGFSGFEAQIHLVDAAKQAGVQLFVPSEFGSATEGMTDEGPLAVKEKVAKHAQSIGLPIVRVYTGLFTEHVPRLGVVEETGRFLVLNPGDKPLSLTSLPDIGGFLAYALTSLPLGKLQNATYRLEGERLSLSQIGTLYGKLKSVTVEHIDKFPDDLPKAALLNYLGKELNSGRAVSSYDRVQGRDLGPGALSNSLLEGHEWKTVNDVFRA
ncbi:NAD(P)-binding protein [Coniophora puteana RWD-64-598 SS2]|uniref:NAD(P)-binding protein n=1 Tax=Coniophora puteana (strain RWD-64-598) TaxID=741705 RepID=A0A5M3MHN6_CONPW|nr:NAD(P)-binding protein [Coniophora puteana RWD-64-598 SS2]EIW78141.1 NAD(P)-binding protein [Coniophora puteana RWD-64-598 SS2]